MQKSVDDSDPNYIKDKSSTKPFYKSDFLQSSFMFVTYLLKVVYRNLKSEIYEPI